MNGLVRLTYDWGSTENGPGPGCYLHPQGGRGPSLRAYLIHSARLIKSKYIGRYVLQCEKVLAADIPEGAPVFPIYWYPRKAIRRHGL